ncbi:MAG: phosphoadenosine phosphosulfate reductase family protein [Crocinitomicaceae bacterium]|nr:phosphoadenosine phosphosulfate reductase family protein [Crocinitomicaceae bacterium]
MLKVNIEEVNERLRDKSPQEIAAWAISVSNNPIVTTNFRPYEGAILHLTTKISPKLKVVWCDTGYNTPNTYRHVKELNELLSLNMFVYVPKLTSGYRDALMGVPDVESDNHTLFTQQVKLEPFMRAMNELQPDLWFTNLRKGQTAFRDNIDIVSVDKKGILKVSPFYYWSDEELDAYLLENGVPNEFKYFDPTKVLENRECGLHS